MCVGKGVNGFCVLGGRVRELRVFGENQIQSWGRRISLFMCEEGFVCCGGSDLEQRV